MITFISIFIRFIVILALGFSIIFAFALAMSNDIDIIIELDDEEQEQYLKNYYEREKARKKNGRSRKRL